MAVSENLPKEEDKKKQSPSTICDILMADKDFGIALEAFRIGMMRSLQICFPCSVTRYDRASHKVDVMPLVQQGFYNGSWHYMKREIIKGVKIRNIQCGGFTIDFPVHIGDTGWIFSGDRDPTLLQQKGALTSSVLMGDRQYSIIEDFYQKEPNQPLIHNFASGFFLPDNWGEWETYRYKDDPHTGPRDGLYIGTAIDTNDGKPDIDSKPPKDDEIADKQREIEKEDPDHQWFQSGLLYDKNISSSFVMQRNGGTTIASSEEKEVKRYSHLKVEGETVNMLSEDLEKMTSTRATINSEDGMVIRSDNGNEKQNLLCRISPGSCYMRIKDGDQGITLEFSKGKLSLRTTSDINMQVGGTASMQFEKGLNVMGEGPVNLQSSKNVNVLAADSVNVAARKAHVVSENEATITCKQASVTAVEDVNLNAGRTVNIGSVKKANINSGEQINLASGNTINVTASEKVNIVTGAETTIMAKEEHASISVSALSRYATIGVTTEGSKSNIEVTAKGEQSPINISTTGESSDVSLITRGEKSRINIESEGTDADVTIKSKEAKLNLETDNAEMQISAKKNLNLSSNSDVVVKSGGNVMIEHEKEKPVVILKGDASIKATGALSVETDGTANVLSKGELNITAAENVVLKSEKTINIEAKSDIGINASGAVQVKAYGNATVESNSQIALDAPIIWGKGNTINLDGNVNINGQLHLNGTGFAPKAHGSDDDDVHYWSTDE